MKAGWPGIVGWDKPLWAQAHHHPPDYVEHGDPALQSELVPPYVLRTETSLTVHATRPATRTSFGDGQECPSDTRIHTLTSG